MTHCSSVCASSQLGEVTVHQAHSLALQHSLNICVSLLHSSLGSFHSQWFSNYCCCCMPIQGIILHSATSFSFLALVNKTIDLPVFLVASVIFGFCVISCTEFQSCLLTSFKGVILVLKPYIVLYVFIFDRPYHSSILSPILCTLDVAN